MFQVPHVSAAPAPREGRLSTPSEPPQIFSIQAARGVAVLLVLGMHTATEAWLLTRNPVWEILHGASEAIGNAGVDLFFVISGAIMYLVTRTPRDRSNVGEAVDFLSRRVLRIYPLYWATLPLALALSDNHFPVRWQELSLYLAPIQHGVTWTLPFELRFYGVVGVLLLVARRSLDTAFLMWSAAQVLVCLLASAGLIRPPLMFDAWLMTEFIMGLGVGALISRGVVFAPRLLAVAGIGGVLAGAVFAYGALPAAMDFRAAVFGLPMAVALYAVVTLEKLRRIRVPALFRRVGDMSYSVYLWHLIVANWLFAQMPLGHVKFMFGLRFALKMVVLSLLVAAVSYWLIERPSLAWGRRLIKRAMGPSRAAADKAVPREISSNTIT